MGWVVASAGRSGRRGDERFGFEGRRWRQATAASDGLRRLKRIVPLEWRLSGDFEVRLDTGETVACSRRFKTAVAHLA